LNIASQFKIDDIQAHSDIKKSDLKNISEAPWLCCGSSHDTHVLPRLHRLAYHTLKITFSLILGDMQNNFTKTSI